MNRKQYNIIQQTDIKGNEEKKKKQNRKKEFNAGEHDTNKIITKTLLD